MKKYIVNKVDELIAKPLANFFTKYFCEVEDEEERIEASHVIMANNVASIMILFIVFYHTLDKIIGWFYGYEFSFIALVFVDAMVIAYVYIINRVNKYIRK